MCAEGSFTFELVDRRKLINNLQTQYYALVKKDGCDAERSGECR